MNYGYISDTPINYKELLERVPQERIWELAIGYQPTPFRRVTNPFRIDTHPGCWFEWGYSRLFLVDYADTRFHNMTCFDAVSHAHNLSFKDALLYIDSMLDVGLASGKPVQKLQQEHKKPRHDIDIGTRAFASIDRKYWKPYGISSKDLMEDEVMALSWYRFVTKDGRNVTVKFNKPVNSYGIVFPNTHKKIYNPHLSGKTGKFITNCVADDIGNWQSVGPNRPLLVISKSYKDHRVLRNLKLNYDCVWMQSESMRLAPAKVKMLSEFYDRIVLLYDNDEAGKLHANAFTSLYNSMTLRKNYIAKFLPSQEKDPGEFILAYGKQNLTTTVKSLLNVESSHHC